MRKKKAGNQMSKKKKNARYWQLYVAWRKDQAERHWNLLTPDPESKDFGLCLEMEREGYLQYMPDLEGFMFVEDAKLHLQAVEEEIQGLAGRLRR